jgi:hypothetical protein
MSPLDVEPPPAGEEVHLPGPSLLPVLLAVGITFILVGVTTYIEMTVAGIVLSAVVILLWVRDTRREIDELPLDEH